MNGEGCLSCPACHILYQELQSVRESLESARLEVKMIRADLEAERLLKLAAVEELEELRRLVASMVRNEE